MNNLNRIICDAINYAFEKKEKELSRDITYICTVIKILPNNNYQLSFNGSEYIARLDNIKPKLYDKLHLVLPQGNIKNKFVLEDVAMKYSK